MDMFSVIVLPGASEEVQKRIVKHAMRNFELLTTPAFQIKNGLSRGNQDGISKEAQRYKDDDTHPERMTEQGLSGNAIGKRDEEAMKKRQRWANIHVLKTNCGSDARGMGETMDTLALKKQCKNCDVFETPILCNKTEATTAAAHAHFTVAMVEFVEVGSRIME